MAKIAFDIKYRPEIEAGKYKVKVEEHEARIVCWDYNGDNLIVCVKFDGGEQGLIYDTAGRHMSKLPEREPDLELYTDEPELTEFQQRLVKFYNDRNALTHDKDGIYNRHDLYELLCKTSKELLELAQKELENSDWIKDIREWCYNKGHLEGYAKGQEDAEKRYQEATSFHYGPFPSWPPPCFVGGPCTNPHHDCVNCHRPGTSGIAKTDTNIK